MPIHKNTSADHPDQGMTAGDIRACRRVATVRNEVIMFRSTGPWSRPHIEAGHPTKPFHVKGKSATWGPHAGFVPYNAALSKAVTPRDIDKGNAANHAAVKDNWARPVPLVLTKAYMDAHLRKEKGITKRPAVIEIAAPASRSGILYIHALKPNDRDEYDNDCKKFVFLAEETSPGIYAIKVFPDEAATAPANALFLKESSAEPLLVMAVPGSDLPITGDYDLFAVCPSWGSYGGKDKKMDPLLDDPTHDRNRQHYQQRLQHYRTTGDAAGAERLERSLAILEANKTPEDPDRGNITPRIFEVIQALNAAMGVPYGPGMKIGQPNIYKDGVVNQRVHHNAESGRPFAPGAEDGFPLTTFHPGGLFGYEDAVVESLADLKSYFTDLFRAGYYVPRNPAWQMPKFMF